MTDRSRGPNPFTGLNNRGFLEGGYNNKAAYEQTLANLQAELAVGGHEIDVMRYWAVAGQPEATRVRLDIGPLGGPYERFFVNVPNTGAQPWGARVYRTLLAWVKAYLDDTVPTTPAPTTPWPTTPVPTTALPTTPWPTTLEPTTDVPTTP